MSYFPASVLLLRQETASGPVWFQCFGYLERGVRGETGGVAESMESRILALFLLTICPVRGDWENESGLADKVHAMPNPEEQTSESPEPT